MIKIVENQMPSLLNSLQIVQSTLTSSVGEITTKNIVIITKNIVYLFGAYSPDYETDEG
jgi:hypothetical protein